MTAQELHIEFDIVVQGLTSRPLGKPLPQEVDWLINGAVDKYIGLILEGRNMPSGKGYEENQKRYDSIRRILRADRDLSVYKLDTENSYSILPYDYRHYESSRSEVYSRCNKPIMKVDSEEPVSYSYVSLPLSKDPLMYFRYTLSHTNDDDTVVLVDGATLFGETPFTDGDEAFMIRDLIKNKINEFEESRNIQCYWEKYDDIYKPNEFIIIGATGEFILEEGNDADIDYTSTSSFLPVYLLTNANPTLTSGISLNKVRNREIKSNEFDIVADFALSKTDKKSPLCKLVDERIYIRENAEFFVSSLSLDYIKQPALISLIYSVGLPLPDYICREVVNLAAQDYIARKGSNRYPLIANQTNKSE